MLHGWKEDLMLVNASQLQPFTSYNEILVGNCNFSYPLHLSPSLGVIPLDDLRDFWWVSCRMATLQYGDPTKSGINIVEWSMLNANVLDFRFVFALSNYGANCLRLGMKNSANYGFFGHRSFLGTL